MSTPKVSIVTPSFNQARFLVETLRCVREQDYPNMEHIVVDGGSTDETLEILRAAPGIRWISEPDRGQVDAINKGFGMATGDILAWLNADDTFDPDTVSTAVAALQRTGADLVYGNLDIVDEHGGFLREFHGIPFDLRILVAGIYYVGQQSTFFRRTLLERAGPLRPEFDNGFDFELWVRFAAHGKLVYEPKLKAQIRVHPSAKSVAQNKVTWSDTARIRAEYWSSTGLPRCLLRSPLFTPVNLWYRLKRQWRIRRSAAYRAKPRVLMFGFLPPPIIGPTATYQALMRSEFPRRYRVSFINLSVAKSVQDIHAFRPGKLVKLAGFLGRELRLLLTHRYRFCCYPIMFNRNAFLKDALLLAVARMFRVPVVLWAHGNNLPDFRDHSPRWLQRIIDHTVRRAAAAIVVGERLRFNFEQHLPPERILAAHDGLDTPALLPKVQKPPGIVTVFYLGNLVPEKGVLVLLEAAAKICAQRRDVRFRIAGAWWREDHRQQAEQIMHEKNLHDTVEFVGVVTGDAKWRELAGADILAFPTFYYYETFGLVLLEAMRAGAALVATRRAAIPEIIEEGVNGLFVEEQSVDDLVEKLLRLINDPGLREQMGRNNQQRYVSYFTERHFGQRISAVFDALSTRPARRSKS